jgi:hypothetical protein
MPDQDASRVVDLLPDDLIRITNTRGDEPTGAPDGRRTQGVRQTKRRCYNTGCVSR